jgi:hypothetical protein
MNSEPDKKMGKAKAHALAQKIKKDLFHNSLFLYKV